MGNIVIVDTEYTTWENALSTNWSGPGQEKEIVQIAAVKVDRDFQEISFFDQLVKPTVNPTLSEFFVSLTTIQQADVDRHGASFQDALKLFYEFTEHNSCSVVCMNADEAVFRRNCKIHNIEFPFTASWHRVRPFAENNGVDMTKNSSGTLHLLTDAPLENSGHTHYALHDVRSMAQYLGFMKKIDALSSLNQLPTDLPSVDPRTCAPFVPL